MSELAIRLLQAHKQSEGKCFYGDPTNNIQQINRIGVAALDAAYAELIERGFVRPQGQIAIGLGIGRATFTLTDQGKSAVGVRTP